MLYEVITQGVTAEDYGKFIGKKFTAYWNPDDGFSKLVNQLMFILAGMHPNNEMQIVDQNAKSITFKLKNVDLSFRDGPMFDVSYQDFLDCSLGIIDRITSYNVCYTKLLRAFWWTLRRKR